MSDSRGSPCSFCDGRCQMAWDACETDAITSSAACPAYEYIPPPGPDFFIDVSERLASNPAQLNYGVAVTDTDGDGNFEFVVAGYGAANQAFEWDGSSYQDIALSSPTLQDAEHRAIGVAACDIDGDGHEELYVLNTDQYSGSTSTSDKLIDFDDARREHVELFALPQNQGTANYVAGRSCACVDRHADGKFGIMVANYGGAMKLFEAGSDGRTLIDVAPEAGVDLTTGGRALVAGPILSSNVDIFANNEGWNGGRQLAAREGTVNTSAHRHRRRLGHRANFMFRNNGDGTFSDMAQAVGLDDPNYTGRGTALFDANGDGLVDIVYGNWNGEHRLFEQSRDTAGGASFTDKAPAAMAEASPIRTVIVADFDNDGYEEIFWNNIPGENRLFRRLPTDEDWTLINAGAAVDTDGHGTGAAVADLDGDGLLELLVSHGESQAQPLSLFSPALGRDNHYLRVMPLTTHGAPARGAVVRLTASGRTQMRIIDAGSGYLCQMEPVAHFGLGPVTAVESIDVVWPGGTCLHVQRPAVDELHTVPFPDGQRASDGCVELSPRARTRKSVATTLAWSIPMSPGEMTAEVGQVITFAWSGYHNVVMSLSKTDFDSCVLDGQQLVAPSSGGRLSITMDQPGTFYYICSVGFHCMAGQKIAITVAGPLLPSPPPPPPPPSIAAIVAASPSHQTLEAALVAAELVGALDGDGPFTVFAPTDAAFSALPAGTLDALLADPSGALTSVLLYHVVSGQGVLSTQLTSGEIETAAGEMAVARVTSSGVFINDAQVTVADIIARNGVVHVIDRVLTPPPPPPPPHAKGGRSFPTPGVAGDPHVHFAHGGQADLRGRDGAIYSFFSAPGVALNVKTEDATFTPPWWPNTTIDGSYITEAHVIARVGGAKRKWANVSFIASRLTEYNTGLDFITGSCGGHAFFFGLGTTLRRCEELSIKPHYSSATFEALTTPSPPPTATATTTTSSSFSHFRCVAGPSPSGPTRWGGGSRAQSTSSISTSSRRATRQPAPSRTAFTGSPGAVVRLDQRGSLTEPSCRHRGPVLLCNNAAQRQARRLPASGQPRRPLQDERHGRGRDRRRAAVRIQGGVKSCVI